MHDIHKCFLIEDSLDDNVTHCRYVSMGQGLLPGKYDGQKSWIYTRVIRKNGQCHRIDGHHVLQQTGHQTQNAVLMRQT